MALACAPSPALGTGDLNSQVGGGGALLFKRPETPSTTYPKSLDASV